MSAFRKLIAGAEPLVAPLVINPISARLAAAAGFRALYLGGGAMGYMKCGTEANLSLRRGSRWDGFWADLKTGYDLFEQSHIPPVVSVCNGRYVFASGTIATANSAVEARCPPEVAGNP